MTENIIKNFQELTSSIRLKGYSSEDFMKFLVKADTLKRANNFLKVIGAESSVRIFMLAFLIYYQPNDFIGKEKNPLETLIYRNSETIVDKVSKLTSQPGSIRELEFLIQQWTNLFKQYQKKDKEDLLQQLAKYHKEVRNFYGEEEEFQETKDNMLDKIEHLAKTLNGEEGLQHVRTSSQYGMIDEKVLYTQLDREMRNGFWNIFLEDLSRTPPNFKQYIELIQTICDKMVDILPQVNKQENAQMVIDNLNSESTRQSMLKRTFNQQDIYNHLFFSLQKLKELHNAVSQNRIDKMIKDLDKVMSKHSKVEREIPRFMRFIIEELELIEAYKNLNN